MAQQIKNNKWTQQKGKRKKERINIKIEKKKE
jgi:hypothetical protein